MAEEVVGRYKCARQALEYQLIGAPEQVIIERKPSYLINIGYGTHGKTLQDVVRQDGKQGAKAAQRTIYECLLELHDKFIHKGSVSSDSIYYDVGNNVITFTNRAGYTTEHSVTKEVYEMRGLSARNMIQKFEQIQSQDMYGLLWLIVDMTAIEKNLEVKPYKANIEYLCCDNLGGLRL